MVVVLSIAHGVIKPRVTEPDCQVMYILRKHVHMTRIDMTAIIDIIR
jgi:hypothetical protein